MYTERYAEMLRLFQSPILKNTDIVNILLHPAYLLICSGIRAMFTNIAVNPRFKFMGSDANWSTMLAEWRDYFRFPANSDNILALWSYNWFTLSGKPPYLMLPSTGWDKSYNG